MRFAGVSVGWCVDFPAGGMEEGPGEVMFYVFDEEEEE